MASVLDNKKTIDDYAINVNDMMQNPRYMQDCAVIINEALRNGYDVLQLENGDIVTTGTKIIVTQYSWDERKQLMQKLTKKERKDREKNNKNPLVPSDD